MNESELKKFCVELMETAEVLYFTTIDGNGLPYTRAMFNLRNTKYYSSLSKLFKNHQNDLLVYLATNTSSSKIKQIKQNPNACVYYCRAVPKDFRGVMLGGKIEIVTDQKVKEEIWQDWWDRYFPKGVEDEDYAVLRLLPKYAEIYYKLQKYILNLE
ncbi:MAG: pyridoxamine 5'-phosphate oxidase family protein [Asgard group archaeon]